MPKDVIVRLHYNVWLALQEMKDRNESISDVIEDLLDIQEEAYSGDD